MNANRLRLLVLSALVAGIAVAGLRWSTPSQPLTRAESHPVLSPSPLGEGDRNPREQPAPPPLLSADGMRTAPAYFDPDLIDPEIFDGTVHADALVISRPRDPAIPGSAEREPPAPLKDPEAAIPIDARTAQADEDLDDLIERELADLSEADRRVWHTVLEGMPIEQAEEILQIWKLTGGPLKHASTAAGMTEALVETAAASPERDATPPATAIPHLSAASDVLQENLRHVGTPGYRRREPDGGTTHLLDLTPGEFRQTTNPLHLAIDGAGFFVLRRDDQIVVTRCGRFDLSPKRELIQRRADGDWKLDPPLVLPDVAEQWLVDELGRMSIDDGSKSPQVVGEIRLAMFLNPQHLKTVDGDLLSATELSGPMHLRQAGAFGVGLIRQGVFEASNATVAGESAAIKLQRQLENLSPQGTLTELPAFAPSHEPRSVIR